MPFTIQHKRGVKANCPALAAGELYFCTDTYELISGTAGGNKLLKTDVTDVTGFVPPLTQAAASHEFLTAYDAATGAFSALQPAVSDLTGFGADDGTFLNHDGTFKPPGGGGGGTPGSSFLKRTIFASSQRAAGTVYQNTTGWPILVIGSVLLNSGLTCVAYSDASNPPTTQLWTFAGAAGGWAGAYPFSFLVKPNEYYKVTGTGFWAWNEYQIGAGTLTDSGELSGSRALASVYQNTSGNLMFLQVQLSGVGLGTALTVYTDAANPPTEPLWLFAGLVAASTSSVFVPILNGDYYKITCASASVVSWREYQLASITATRTRDMMAAPALRKMPAQNWINNTGKTVFAYASFLPTGSVSTGVMRTDNGLAPLSIVQGQSHNTSGSAVIYGPVLPADAYSLANDSGTPDAAHWYEYLLTS